MGADSGATLVVGRKNDDATAGFAGRRIVLSARRSGWLTFALAVLLLPTLAACSRGGNGADSSTDGLDAATILQRASTRLAETQTIRFGLDIAGETYVDDARTIRLLDARGELVRPDRVRTDFKIEVLGGVTVSTSLIIIGAQRWSTDLITGRWGPAPQEFGYDPTVLFDNQNGIGPVMDRVQSPVRLADETVRDRACYRIRAQVDPGIIDPLTAGTMTRSPITVDLWIDRGNANLVRARLSEPPGTPDTDPTVWTLDLSGHGSSITIDPPA